MPSVALRRSIAEVCYASLTLLLFLSANRAFAQIPAFAFAGVQTTIPITGLSGPEGIAVDSAGNLYVADTGHNRIIELTTVGIEKVLLEGIVVGKPLNAPNSLAVDSSGALYLTDSGNNRVIKRSTNGAVNVLGAGLSRPSGVAVDNAGDVLISDTGNNQIVVVSGGRQTILIAANELINGEPLSEPTGLTVTGDVGNVYTNSNLSIADTGNNRIVFPYWYLGTLHFQNPAVGAFKSPTAFAATSLGGGYIADTGNDRVVSELYDESASVFVPATVSVGIKDPHGMTSDSSGNLYIADTGNDRVIKLATANSIDFGKIDVGKTTKSVPLTFLFYDAATAGPPEVLTQGAPNLDFRNADTGTCHSTAGVYPAGTCIFDITFDSTVPGPREGALLLSGTGEGISTATTVYLNGTGLGQQKIYDPGTQSTLASGLSNPRGVVVDGGGNVYVSDFGANEIIKITSSGKMSNYVDLPSPGILALDAAGTLYTPDLTSCAYAGSSGEYSEIHTVSIQKVINEPRVNGCAISIAVNNSGDLFVADLAGGDVVEMGYSAQPLSGGFVPDGVAVDGSGNVFIADSTDWLVWKVTPKGVWSTIGSGYNRPQGLAVDGVGNLYVADFGNDRVVEVTPAGKQTSIGEGLLEPTAVAVDGFENIYIADFGNSRVVKIDRHTPPKAAHQPRL